MDVAMLAQQIIVSVLPLLIKGGEEFAKKSGEATFQGAKALWTRISGRFAGQAEVSQAFGELAAQPESAERRAEVRRVVTNALAADPALTADVAPLVEQLSRAVSGSISMTANVSGGTVENVVQVGTIGGDFNLGKR